MGESRGIYSPKPIALAVGALTIIFLVFCCIGTPSFAQTATTVGGGQAIRLIVDSSTPSSLEPLDHDLLRRFYQARDFRPAWTDSGAEEKQAAVAITALAHSGEEGLSPVDYHIGQLTKADGMLTPAERDVLLTDGFLRYEHDLRLGSISSNQSDMAIDQSAKSFDSANALQNALADNDLTGLIKDLSPPYPDYAELKAALARYRKLAANGGWPSLPSGDEIKLGSSDPRLPALIQRMAFEEPDTDLSNIDNLRSAILRYQAHNGLEPDGRVGARTQAMLNVSASERVEQIVANMERRRWLPLNLGQNYVWVNVAGAELRVISQGKIVLASRVIVGDRKHQTPDFHTMAVAVTTNPPWNVPPSIARKEILPKLRRDPKYLQSQQMVLVNGPAGDPYGLTINWRTISSTQFPYRIQQQPGPGNSLGQIKIEMPNRFDVYLHDTPAKNLFNLQDRALSHGCIRVQKIAPLASFMLTGDIDKDKDSLNDMVATDQTQHFLLKNPFPVYIFYWTAVTNDDGSFGFRPDIYGRDKQLITLGNTQKNTAAFAFGGCFHSDISG